MGAPLGGVVGAFAVIAGLLFVDKVGAGALAGLTIAANILMSLAIDHLGWFGVHRHTISTGRAVGAPFMIIGIAAISRFQLRDGRRAPASSVDAICQILRDDGESRARQPPIATAFVAFRARPSARATAFSDAKSSTKCISTAAAAAFASASSCIATMSRAD